MPARHTTTPGAFAPVRLHTIEVLYRIRLLRIARGYTPEQLSALIGRPQGFITRAEGGLSLRRLNTRDLFALAVVFDVDPAFFLPRGRERQSVMLQARAYTLRKDGSLVHTVEQQVEGRVECVYRVYEII